MGKNIIVNLYVNLYDNGKMKSIVIHRIVALLFIDNPENKQTVNHKDFNRDNNYFENLEWNTITENIRYSFKRGR
jgi:hypothetical protein